MPTYAYYAHIGRDEAQSSRQVKGASTQVQKTEKNFGEMSFVVDYKGSTTIASVSIWKPAHRSDRVWSIILLWTERVDVFAVESCDSNISRHSYEIEILASKVLLQVSKT
jgi:hypothetical protein